MTDERECGNRELVRRVLAMKPESVVIGETDDPAAYDVLVAMNSGISGSTTTRFLDGSGTITDNDGTVRRLTVEEMDAHLREAFSEEDGE